MYQTITADRLLAALEDGGYVGFCLGCGSQVDGVEPDARRYPCDVCDELKVYGAEEILLMIAA